MARVTVALAHADGVAPDEFKYSLYEYIDPDVLAALEAHPNSNWELSFDVSGHEVSVSGDETVSVDGIPL